MTVADLIAELQRLPQQLPARLLMGQFELLTAEGDGIPVSPEEADAQAIRNVYRSAGYVLIEGD